MKRFIIIISICFVYSYIMAQHRNIEKIKNFYQSIDKTVLIDTFVTKKIEQNKDSCDYFDISADLIIKSKDLAKIANDSSVIMFVPMLRNAKDYSFDKNIYDFLYVDTTNIQIRYCNMQNEVVTILNQEGLRNITYSKKRFTDLKNVIDVITKEKPEVLLIESWIFKDKSNDNVNYMFLKGDKIYVYRSKYKDMYELNKFVRKFFKEKEFKERAILNENGLILVG